jgi:hypothetical protein
MKTTYENERQSYLEAYTPEVAPASHWSKSKEWLEFLSAKDNAVRLYPIGSLNAGRVADTPEMQAAYQRFLAAYPPEEPEPEQPVDARAIELQAAEIELRRAVSRMRRLAHGDRIVGLVQRMVEA